VTSHDLSGSACHISRRLCSGSSSRQDLGAKHGRLLTSTRVEVTPQIFKLAVSKVDGESSDDDGKGYTCRGIEGMLWSSAGLKSDRSKEAGLLPLLELQGHL